MNITISDLRENGVVKLLSPDGTAEYGRIIIADHPEDFIGVMVYGTLEDAENNCKQLMYGEVYADDYESVLRPIERN